MTIEKAIERLENHTQYYIPVDDLPAFEMACDALREQIPEDEKCATCVNAKPSIACVNCGSKHWNYCPKKDEPEKMCDACENKYPSEACVDCDVKHRFFRRIREVANMDKQEFELATFLETEQEQFVQNNIAELRSPMRLDWLQRLELSKAMLGRGVSEKMAWQIIRDFQVRMDSLKELIK